MWAYHLSAFKHDLWQVFASDVASKLLGAVLAEGLVILSQRYNSVKPSMRRLPQMKLALIIVWNYTAMSNVAYSQGRHFVGPIDISFTATSYFPLLLFAQSPVVCHLVCHQQLLYVTAT